MNIHGSSSENIESRNIDTILFWKGISKDLIFEHLQGYLNDRGGGIDRKDINNILDSSSNFQILNKANYHWKLNKESSTAYYFDMNYRSKVDLQLSNSNIQLWLDLSISNVKLEEPSYYDNISNVSSFASVHTLKLKNCKNITDISGLGNLHNNYEYTNPFYFSL